MFLKKKVYLLFFLCWHMLMQCLCYAQKDIERNSPLSIVNAVSDNTNRINEFVGSSSNSLHYIISDLEKYGNEAIDLSIIRQYVDRNISYKSEIRIS